MATLTSSYSLVEQAKRIDPDGKLSKIVEVLNRKTGMILEEAPWIASNDVWVNKTVRRATLPTASRRKLNKGVSKGVSRTTEVMDVIEMLGIYAEYDKDYIDSFPDAARARLQEAKAFLEGMGQTLTSDILYCDSNADPDGMHGLSPRLDTVDSEFVFSNSGSSAVTSIYVVTWGENECYLAYPKNMANLGISHQDLGEVTLEEYDSSGAATGRLYQGYRDYFQAKCGLVVRNPKCIGRIGNIESSGSTNTFDEDQLIALLGNMEVNASTRIYCNQTIMTQARIKMKDKSNVHWVAQPSNQALAGLPFLSFDEIPVRKIDKDILLNSETVIS
jgi:hypothetical protein